MELLRLNDIQQAQRRLAGVVQHTPLIEPTRLGDGLRLKPESLQPIGSFKIRGAYNRIAALFDAGAPKPDISGVIAYSSGNHAQGVAYAARCFKLPALIVMPNNAPAVKVEATRSYGAEVVLYDPATEKREDVAARLMAGKPWLLVPPFDDPFVIAGQGTVGLEIFEDWPDVEQVLVPVGGGGLISGVATALKALKPSITIIGIEPELADDAYQSLRSGQLVSLSAADASRTVADGVRTLSLSALTFAHIQRYVDQIVTVSEAEIREATRRLLIEAKLLIEPAGALPLAGWLFRRDELPDAEKRVLVLSGGNSDPALLRALLT